MNFPGIKEIIAIATGGAFGSVARFGLSSWIQRTTPYQHFPLGIFICNSVGCFVIGVLYALLENNTVLNTTWRAAIFIGLLGGFTTFSSFSLDTVYLITKGEIFTALWNVFATVSVCLLATSAGIWIVRTCIQPLFN